VAEIDTNQTAGFGLKAWHWTVLACAVLAIFLFDMGGRGLNEPDEGRYANIAMEALEPEHSWLDPQMSDVGHYDKPPLIYWTTALSFHFFGINEWAARVPSFLGAMLALTGVGWAAFRLYGAGMAWWSVLVAATMAQIWGMGRTLTPDMLLTGWCTLAIAAWAETRHRDGAWKWWALQLLFWTLAWWTKATAMLIPLLGLTLYVYLSGDMAGRKALKLPMLLPAALLLGLPWFLYIMRIHPQLEDFFLHREMIGRVAGHVDGRRGPVYFYLLVILLAWLPWWPLALYGYWKGGIRFRWRTAGFEPYVIGTGLIVFSLVSSKLQTYILPLAPWAALLATRLMVGYSGFKPRRCVALAGAAVACYMAAGFFLPQVESSLGRNSSMRTISALLKARGAKAVYADRYWPGLEFYSGESVFYFGVKIPDELEGSDESSEHFRKTGSPIAIPDSWFVHYKKQTDTPFEKWLEDSSVQKVSVGDFVVGKIPQGRQM